MAFLPGKNAYVAVGSVHYKFDAWKPKMSNKLSPVTNFESGGFDEFIAGITNGKVTVSGPYDANSMPFALGNTYNVTLGYSDSLTLTASAILENIDEDVKVADAIRVSLDFQFTGAFTAAIV